MNYVTFPRSKLDYLNQKLILLAGPKKCKQEFEINIAWSKCNRNTEYVPRFHKTLQYRGTLLEFNLGLGTKNASIMDISYLRSCGWCNKKSVVLSNYRNINIRY